MKLPDGNKPIRVGDSSFIYKGVYHPIVWLGEFPYRPRVETLVVKDGRYVYMAIADDIDAYPIDKRNHKYSIPGGSVDADSTKIQQAEAETNEEALISIKNTYPTGISYYELYDPGFLLKGGDMPIEYVGSFSDVFCAMYEGPYDKSKVEEKDLDDYMANHGKFHDITQIAKYLRKEHIHALLSCPFVRDDVKFALSLNRHDVVSESVDSGELAIVVPDGKLYHGSSVDFDVFHPMSLDLGNIYQEPGWSTFCFDNYDSAKLFAFAKSATKMIKSQYDVDKDDTEIQFVFIDGKIYTSMKCFEFIRDTDMLETPIKLFVYTIDSSKVNVGVGNDPSLKEYTFREDGILPMNKDELNLSIMDLREEIEVVDSIKDLKENHSKKENPYSNLLTRNYLTEPVRKQLEDAVAKGDIKPGDDIRDYMQLKGIAFDSEDISIPNLVLDIDESIMESSIIMEEKFPEDCYGLPERKAYPLPDEKHVRSAIRFFNYASKDEERELAKNINKKIKEFGITDLNVGETNRFLKYYKPIREGYTLKEFLTAMESVMERINDTSTTDQEKPEIYDKMSGMLRMFIDCLEVNAFDLPENDNNKILYASYNALAEAYMNRIECTKIMEGTIRELSLPVMEADDEDDEIGTATDYTNDADDTDIPEAEDYTDTEDTGDDEPNTIDNTQDEGDTGDNEPDTTNDTPDAEDVGDDTTDDMGGTPEGDDTTGTDDTTDDVEGEEPDIEETENNSNKYDNKKLKNYFLLKNFISLYEVVQDVLNSVNGVVLPTPDANAIMVGVIKTLQLIKDFTETFIQFQFDDNDYAANLYYYNILVTSLKMNMELVNSAFEISDNSKKVNKEVRK